MSKGKLVVFTGPMFSGKSGKLIRRMERFQIAKRDFLVFKPQRDKTTENEISSRSRTSMGAITIASADDFRPYLEREGLKVIGMDEAQFFGDWIIGVVREFIERGVRVFVAGLDLDFMRRPFGPIPELMAIADEVCKLKAVCHRCGSEEAMFTQRVTKDGKPILEGDQVVLKGDGGTDYQARCRDCFGLE